LGGDVDLGTPRIGATNLWSSMDTEPASWSIKPRRKCSGEHPAAAVGLGYNGRMAENSDNELAALQPGQIETKDNGERFGRSAGGCLVQLRRRISEPGFVVTVDTEPRPGVPTELITHDWAAANAAFDRFMHEY
jgi:hypothetical protein